MSGPILLLCLLVTPPVPETPAALSAEVRSLMAIRCFVCHGPDGESRKADMRLDTRSGQRAVVTPGHPDQSELIARITSEDDDHRMPPSGPPLTPEEIELLGAWIQAGAPWQTHWSFEPIVDPPLPAVSNMAWVIDPLDTFVLAALEARGLQPASPASSEDWLRRIHFDLTGLPPTIDAVAGYAATDDGLDARTAVVDALLASPHFGEHWGRHWLDLVRYAETCGHEFDYPIPHAWRYRDWVIRAFNQDVPYDRFIHEQIAGDLLPDPRIDPITGLNDSLPGTGFWHLSQGTHAPTDVREDEAERIDNQIDVLGKSIIGLTISCARCHDHKFDPIGTDEFYALSGYLQSSRRRDAYLDPHGDIEIGLADIQAARHNLVSTLAAPQTPSPPIQTTDDSKTVEDFEDFLEGWFFDGQAFTAVTPAGTAYLQDDSVLMSGSGMLHSGLRSPRAQGTIRSPSFTIDRDYLHHRVKGRSGEIRVVIDGFLLDEYNPLLFEDCLKKVDDESWHHVTQWLGKYRGHVAWIEYADEGDGWIAIDEIRTSDSVEAPSWSAPAPPEPPGVDAAELQAGLVAIHASESGLPSPVRALAMMDGTPEEAYVSLRGNHETRGPLAPRSVPAVLATNTSIPPGASGRLEMAQALTAPTNPLTARVMANRIWHHIMGRGLVSTADDFGAMGQLPSNAALLDHLAIRLQSDWSIKNLIRDIARAQTYAMSSQPDPAAVLVDPENTLLHHHPLKRLTAESIRDAMILVSGQLDRTIGGHSVPVHLTDHMTGRGRPNSSGPLDGDGRRTIYLEIRRNFLSPMLLAFDLPLPLSTVGRRHTSNVPAQALILMNDPFVHEQADHWAAAVLLQEADDAQRISTMFIRAFARTPQSAELAAAKAFLSAQAASGATSQEAYTSLAHALFNTKEFIYLD